MYISRFEVSHIEKIRRSVYVFLRDELERRLLDIALVAPYRSCEARGVPYPFAEPGEMRPKKRELSREYLDTRPFLIIFLEEALSEEHQKYIRFSNSNKVRKDNISLIPGFNLQKSIYSGVHFFEKEPFFDLLEELLDVDYALLIQRDTRYKKRNRYSLTHFHVKIDWPTAEAAEDLAKELRYISKNLYEKGERYADALQQKLFEYYGWHHQSVGGRRTAALVAAQYLKSVPGLSTVYVSSSESRTFTRYSERGVGRYAIIQLDKTYAEELAKSNGINMKAFRQGYVLGETEEHYAVLFFVMYRHTEWGVPPMDGKLRIVNPDYNWLAVDIELVLPLPDSITSRPIRAKWVYKS